MATNSKEMLRGKQLYQDVFHLELKSQIQDLRGLTVL